MAAGANYNAGGSVTVPNVAPGSYFLLIFTEAGGGVLESNESNSVLAAASNVIVPTSTATETATETPTGTPADTLTPTSAVAVCENAPRNDCAATGRRC